MHLHSGKFANLIVWHIAPCSWTFDSDWSYPTSFLESPSCKQQIIGLFCLHNFVSQFLTINIIYVHIHTYLLLVLFLRRTSKSCSTADTATYSNTISLKSQRIQWVLNMFCADFLYLLFFMNFYNRMIFANNIMQ